MVISRSTAVAVRLATVIALAFVLVVAGHGLGGVVAAQEASDRDVTVTLTSGEGGADLELVSSGGDLAALGGLDPAEPLPVRWDLTALDRAEFGSDLVRVEVLDVAGPGRLNIHTPTAHGRQALVFDGTAPIPDGAPAVMVLQVGRLTDQRWSVDEPGDYTVALRANIPRAGGGAAVAVVGEAAAGRSLESLGELSGESPSLTLQAVDEPRAAPAQAGGVIVIDDGHVDVGPRIVDGEWRVQIKDDTVTPYVWRDLVDVVLHARDAARVDLPDAPVYAFLGSPGDRYHILPQAQRQGIVWPGWNSQDISVVDAVPGSVTWRLGSVDGPGRFVLYITDSFGEIEVYFDTDEALPQDLEIPRNSHVHGNWAFSAPGVYRIGVEMRATSTAGAPLTDARTLTVVVGDDIAPSTVAPNQNDDDEPDGRDEPDDEPDERSPGVEVTTDLRDDDDEDDRASGSGGSGGSGSGSGPPLVRTGADALRTAGLAVAVIAFGLVLRGAARKRIRNRSYS